VNGWTSVFRVVGSFLSGPPVVYHPCHPPDTFLLHICFRFICGLNVENFSVIFTSSDNLFHFSTTLISKLSFLISIFACLLVRFQGLASCLVFWYCLLDGKTFAGFSLSKPLTILNSWAISCVCLLSSSVSNPAITKEDK
jgi:hypothetical protein